MIVAGGRGTRMGAAQEKQFIELDGKPILRRTIEAFLSMKDCPEIIVVLPEDRRQWWRDYCRRSGFLPKFILVSGGFTRFHSVRNALQYVPEGALVAVHDGVRPFVSPEFLDSMAEAALDVPALIPVTQCTDSMRLLNPDGSTRVVDRKSYVCVQTPQFFHSEVLLKAYGQGYDISFTDDASVVEAYGCPVTTFPGPRWNIKITTPEDLGAISGEIFRDNG